MLMMLAAGGMMLANTFVFEEWVEEKPGAGYSIPHVYQGWPLAFKGVYYEIKQEPEKFPNAPISYSPLALDAAIGLAAIVFVAMISESIIRRGDDRRP